MPYRVNWSSCVTPYSPLSRYLNYPFYDLFSCFSMAITVWWWPFLNIWSLSHNCKLQVWLTLSLYQNNRKSRKNCSPALSRVLKVFLKLEETSVHRKWYFTLLTFELSRNIESEFDSSQSFRTTKIRKIMIAWHFTWLVPGRSGNSQCTILF